MALGGGYFALGAGSQNELPYPKSSENREGGTAARSQSCPATPQRHRSGAGCFHAKARRRMSGQLTSESVAAWSRHISYEMPQRKEGQKSLFGLFLVQARVATAVSQTAMAKAAGYNLRNINGVENGKQDPGIMTALALVKTTGVDIGNFFNSLYQCWSETAILPKN